MKFYIVCFIVLLILSGCSSNEKKFNGKLVNNFSHVVELKGTRVFENEIGIRYIKQIDSLVVISTMNAPFIHIYNKNENFIADIGKKGRGPSEFSVPPLIRDAIKLDQAINIFTYDHHVLTLNRIDLMTSIDSNKVIIDQKYELPKELTGVVEVFYVDDTMLTGIYDDHFSKQLDEKRGGFYYNLKMKELKIFPLFNLEIIPYAIMPATNLNARMTTISPNRTKLASVMLYYPGLEIIHLDSIITPSRYLLAKNPPKPTFELKDFKEGEITTYYKFIYSSNNFIYLLYAGIQDKNFGDPYETRIQVMDWNGNPVRVFKIPAKYSLDMFIVDEKNKCFYGLDYTINDAIYKFDYSSIK